MLLVLLLLWAQSIPAFGEAKEAKGEVKRGLLLPPPTPFHQLVTPLLLLLLLWTKLLPSLGDAKGRLLLLPPSPVLFPELLLFPWAMLLVLLLLWAQLLPMFGEAKEAKEEAKGGLLLPPPTPFHQLATPVMLLLLL